MSHGMRDRIVHRLLPRNLHRAALAVLALLLTNTSGLAAADGNVNALNADGSTALMWAVHAADHDEMQRLIDAGADVTVESRYGVTAMSLAAEVADLESMRLLLDAGADVDSPNPENQTALLTVARTGNIEAAELLLDNGATVDARENWGEQTALMWAAARRHPPMIQLLLDHGADINAAGKDRDYQRHVTAEGRPKNMDTGGLTPLLYATRENCLECVEVLIANGADINLPDPDGVSPLHLAIMNANWDVAQTLIEAGADVNQWDIYGAAPLFTILGNYSRDGARSIDLPNEYSGREILDRLLAEGANPNMQLFFRPAGVRGSTNTRGATPLIRMANSADTEMIDLLMEHGADPTIYMADRQTPIHAVLAGRAREEQVVELIRLFHEAGTDINVVALVNHREEVRGGTALHYAVRNRYPSVIRELAALGIDLDAKDQDGLTALDYTQSRGFMPFMALQTPTFEEEAALLRELGATVEIDQQPEWPVLGPPQGVWADIFPIGEPAVYPPIYTHLANQD